MGISKYPKTIQKVSLFTYNIITQVQKKVLGVLLILFGIFLTIFFSIRILEHQAFTSRIQAKALREFVIYAIQRELSKAVDMGIIGFSLMDGVVVEDLMISMEDDFSEGRYLIQCKKLLLKLSSLFSSQPYIRKIIFIEPSIVLDVNDPSFPDIIEYVLNSSIQEVEFKRAKILILEGRKELVRLPLESNGIVKRKGNEIQMKLQSEGFLWEGNFKGIGSIQYNPNNNHEKDFSFNFYVEWNRLPVKNFSGYLLKLTGFEWTQGSIKGEKQIHYKNKEWDLKTRIKFQDAFGFIEGIDNLSIQNYNFDWMGSFQSKNTILSTNKKNQEQQIWKIERVYLNSHGKIEILKEDKDEEVVFKIQTDIKNLEKFLKNISLPNKIKLQGKLKGDWIWSEKNIRNKTIDQMGNFKWEDGVIQTPNINITIHRWNLNSKDTNQFISEFNGEVFGKQWNWKAEGEALTRKAMKPNGDSYYPVAFKGLWKGELEELNLSNWDNLIEYIINSIEQDIQNRNKKLIPEDYFTEFRLYRYFLENLNLSFQMKIHSIITNQSRLKNWILDTTIKSGSVRLIFHQDNSFNKFDFYAKYDMKFPYIDFKGQTNNLPWNRKVGTFCGFHFMADTISFDFQFRSTGADTYNLSRNASFISSWNFEGWRVEERISSIKNPDITFFQSQSARLYYEWQYYGDNHILRNIDLQFSNGDFLRGNGSGVGDIKQINLVGKKGEEVWRWNIEEKKGECRFYR